MSFADLDLLFVLSNIASRIVQRKIFCSLDDGDSLNAWDSCSRQVGYGWAVTHIIYLRELSYVGNETHSYCFDIYYKQKDPEEAYYYISLCHNA